MPPTHSLMVPRTIINALLFECIIYMNYTIKKKQPPEAKSAIQKIESSTMPHFLLSSSGWQCSQPVCDIGRQPIMAVLCAFLKAYVLSDPWWLALLVEHLLNILARKRLVWESCTEPLRWKSVISVSTFETMSSFLINNNRNVIEVTQQPDNVCKYCWITGRA